MDASSGSAGGGNRFAHLLKPIRDLAQNWNVDIASELTEYLGELEHITISFDGGVTSLNFAEAALVVQGSSLIYGKKVESLYSLIFHTLELVTAQRVRMTRGGRGGGDADADAEMLMREEEFLSLDDVIKDKEGSNIDLDEDDDIDGGAGRTGLALRTPRAMLGAMALERRGNGAGDAFRIVGSCIKDGTLILDHREALELSPILPDTAVRAALQGTGAGISAVPKFQGFGDDGPTAGGGFDDDDDDDDDDGFGGGGGGGDEDYYEEPQQVDGAAAAAAPTRGAGSGKLKKKAIIDPWAQLDPHDDGQTATRPFRKARTYTILPNATDIAQDGVDATRTATLPPVVPTAAKPYYSEFEYASKRERRRVARVRLALAKQRQAAGVTTAGLAHMDDEDGEVDDDGDDGGDWGDGGGFGDDDGGFDDMVFGGAQAGGGDMNAITSFGFAMDSPGGAGSATTPHTPEVEFVQLLRHHIRQFMKGCEQYAAETQLTKRVGEWRDKMDPLLRQQDTRPAFNMFSYGTKVIDRLEEIAQETAPTRKHRRPKHKQEPVEADFADVVEDVDSFEVCRTFLACLQLANDGNVQLLHDDMAKMTKAGGAVIKPAGLRLKLLSKERRIDVGEA